MLIARQMDVRSNIRKYFDMAYNGEVIVIPRKQDRNVVIISEAEYYRLSGADRLSSYAHRLKDSGRKEKLISARSDDLKTHNIRKLNSMRTLRENWNGNGAPEFPGSVVDKVQALIPELVIQPEVFPTALCTIQLEYDNSRKDHLEIEIGEADHAEVFIVMYNGEELYESIQVSPDAINERIGAFYG